MSEAVTIMLVEDNPGDARLLEEAMRGTLPPKRIIHAKDGLDAIELLENPATPKPKLIFLDLNLPRMGGKEFLAKIKESDVLKAIPVIVLTTSKAERDVRDCYDLGANCFISKPLTLDEFMETMNRVNLYWFQVARLSDGS